MNWPFVGRVLQLCGLAWAAPGISQEFPRVQFIYGDLTFDRYCEKWLNTKIDQSWANEVRARIGSWQDFWDKEAPLLLGTTASEIGKPFPYREAMAVLTLCPISSMSVPLLINVRRFIEGPTQQKPQPMFLFSALVFHELLHTYIGRYTSLNSDLLKKYKNEPLLVLTHVHLLAAMKQVYLKLGRTEELREIVARDSASDDPAYGRAWFIVNDIEGHEAFVKELRP